MLPVEIWQQIIIFNIWDSEDDTEFHGIESTPVNAVHNHRSYTVPKKAFLK